MVRARGQFSRRRQSGITLIELMVSVVILSVGVAGVAALQLVSLQQNRNAIIESDAVRLVNDLIDRILANPQVVYGPIAAFDSTPTTSKNCKDNECDQAEMAAFDIAYWLCSVGSIDPATDTSYTTCDGLGILGALPYGTGTVIYDATTRVYTITVRWQSDRDGTTRNIAVEFKRDEL